MVLRKAGFVSVRRRGREQLYRLRAQALQAGAKAAVGRLCRAEKAIAMVIAKKHVR
jgi:DNA-binding transcriptional ArsR family regulator